MMFSLSFFVMVYNILSDVHLFMYLYDDEASYVICRYSDYSYLMSCYDLTLYDCYRFIYLHKAFVDVY